MQLYLELGILFWSIIFSCLYAIRPSSRLNKIKISNISKFNKTLCITVLSANILACTVPMSWNPVWNGEISTHHKQYEHLADAFLKGQLYLDIDVDKKLLEMTNPYDPVERYKMNVDFKWDHSFYNGRYYVYFGVVPVILLFLPYKVIAGESLATYHATQFFTALFIIGLFATFYFIAKKFFPRMPLSVYLMLSTALSLISISLCTAHPSLYCTAISAGLCMEIWSIYCFLKLSYDDISHKNLYVLIGAILGALAFGCRPTIALANLLILVFLPKLVQIFHNQIKKFLFSLIIPYIIIGTSLAMYNYFRFDNFIEFGQTYQLTIADQHLYTKNFLHFEPFHQLNGLLQNFFGVYLTDDFKLSKCDNFSGAFLNYPMLLLPILTMITKSISPRLELMGFLFALMLIPLLITIVQIQYSPILIERYLMDFYWLMAIATFISAGFLLANRKLTIIWAICFVSFLMILQSLRIFLTPNDLNLTAYYPELLPEILNVILFKWF